VQVKMIKRFLYFALVCETVTCMVKFNIPLRFIIKLALYRPRLKLKRCGQCLLKMRQLITILLTIVSLSTFGQEKELECLDTPDQLNLFKQPLKYDSTPTPIEDTTSFLPDSIYLVVDLTKEIKYDYLIKGIRIYVVNTTDKDLVFDASGILDIICQAKNETGQWTDIETRYSGWHNIPTSGTLTRKSFYKAVMPCYKGTVETTLRYRFRTGDKSYYSNEFPGTINSGQLPKIKK
jgi:hypothetical protein